MFTENRRITVVVLQLISFLGYSFLLYTSLPVKKSEINAETANGKLLFQKYNCTACHQVYGLGGFLGPDITNVYSLKGPAYIKAFLQNGTDIMPNFLLSTYEMTSLTAYLKEIDESGKADPRTFSINYNGTIEQ